MRKLLPLFLIALLPTPLFAAVPSGALDGVIRVDGSSTVYPITEAVAEEFGRAQPNVKVTVGISGTGGGMKKFTVGEIDVADASRPIKASEAEIATKNSVSFIELPIAYDALTIVVNPKNTWATTMTVKELKKLWEPEAQGKITKWNQIRADWPDKEIKLYGPGVDSGTFDYFTEAIVGKTSSSRGDYTSSEDDNVLVQGVASDMYALGFFGVSYYEENQSKLKAVSIDDENDANGKGAYLPTTQNVEKGLYAPLARPLFVYVNTKSLEKPEVAAFMNFYLSHGSALVKEVGYIPLPKGVQEISEKRLASKTVGSVFGSGNTAVGLTLEELFKRESATGKAG